MKGKFIRNVLMVTMMISLFTAFSCDALAASAYNQSSGLAGTVNVTMEVGYNGNTAYWLLGASDYVDARMLGMAYYYGVDGNKTILVDETSSQVTYKMIERQCERNVYRTQGSFIVDSADGSITRTALVAD